MKAYLVAGLGFGDEGKGSIVDYLCRVKGVGLVVRYNGGPQAAHNVVTPEGVHHTFSQFGSGTLAGAITYLSKYMLVEPYAMINEANTLELVLNKDPFDMLVVDKECVIITPWHWIANRIKETFRGACKHGSCGMGVGEARHDQLIDNISLHVGQINDRDHALKIMADIKRNKLVECAHYINDATRGLYDRLILQDPEEVLADYYKWYTKLWCIASTYLEGHVAAHADENIAFEGAQGVLLDEIFGFAPHNTWTDCTFENAKKLIGGIDIEREEIGVIRTYMTRHGAGAFPTEDPSLRYEDLYNFEGPWQGPLRFGHFDAVLLRYALNCIQGVDYLAVTHIDQTKGSWVYCNHYVSPAGILSATTTASDNSSLSREKAAIICGDFSIPKVESLLNTPVRLVSFGPSSENKAFITMR